jgi:hypothetical protein
LRDTLITVRQARMASSLPCVWTRPGGGGMRCSGFPASVHFILFLPVLFIDGSGPGVAGVRAASGGLGSLKGCRCNGHGAMQDCVLPRVAAAPGEASGLG